LNHLKIKDKKIICSQLLEYDCCRDLSCKLYHPKKSIKDLKRPNFNIHPALLPQIGGKNYLSTLPVEIILIIKTFIFSSHETLSLKTFRALSFASKRLYTILAQPNTIYHAITLYGYKKYMINHIGFFSCCVKDQTVIFNFTNKEHHIIKYQIFSKTACEHNEDADSTYKLLIIYMGQHILKIYKVHNNKEVERYEVNGNDYTYILLDSSQKIVFKIRFTIEQKNIDIDKLEIHNCRLLYHNGISLNLSMKTQVENLENEVWSWKGL
jgi:hypothetical protein